MAKREYFCNDPSHPPTIRDFTQETLYRKILMRVDEQARAGAAGKGLTDRIAAELIPQLTSPSDSVEEGYRLQGMRRRIAEEWGDVFHKTENLCFVTGWFIIDCMRAVDDELHYVLCLFALEAIRNVFPTVNQLRSALTQDTFGYWRTLYETLVKSRFIKRYSLQDVDLPGRFLYYNNSSYLQFYRMFAPADDIHASSNMWIKSERQFENRFPDKTGKGDYGWVYPILKSKKNIPIKKPTFRLLINCVDKDSTFSEIYYQVATSKTHGRFIWNPLMVRPEGRGVTFDPFSVGEIGLVLDLTMPVFEETLENTAQTCTTPEHGIVRDIVRDLFKNLSDSVAEIKASDPIVHLGLDL